MRASGLVAGVAYFYEDRKIENYALAKYSIFALNNKKKKQNNPP